MTLHSPIVVVVDTSKTSFDELKHLVDYTDDYIKTRLANITDERLKVNSIIGCVLRKHLIYKTFDIPMSEQKIIKNPQGKPLLKDYPTVYFNISHTQDKVACIVYDKPVGIDIQSVLPYNPKVANYIFDQKEQKYITSCKDKNLAYTKAWTKKESLAKAIGCGIALLGKEKTTKVKTTTTKEGNCVLSYSILTEKIK